MYTIAAALCTGLLTYGLSGWIAPTYEAEAILFVPLMVVEKQIAQDGFGFGGPAEVDAHIEILRSPTLSQSVEASLMMHTEEAEMASKVASSLSAKRTPNGAISIRARAKDRQLAMHTIQAAIDTADAHKSRMLKTNRMSAAVQAATRFTEKAKDVIDIRDILDSLRTHSLEANERERIHLQTRIFEYEVRLSHAVEELARYESQRQRLSGAAKAELPATYVLGTVSAENEPGWPPRLLFSALAMSMVLLLSVFYHFALHKP